MTTKSTHIENMNKHGTPDNPESAKKPDTKITVPEGAVYLTD